MPTPIIQETNGATARVTNYRAAVVHDFTARSPRGGPPAGARARAGPCQVEACGSATPISMPPMATGRSARRRSSRATRASGSWSSSAPA